jgi:hypothetical protein
MADNHDLTTRELAIKLDAVLDVMLEIKDQMVTKAVFETWQQGNDRRIARVEDDLKAWIRESTEAHVSLDRDSKARHKETEANIDALQLKLEADIDKSKTNTRAEIRQLRQDFEESRKDNETVKRSRINIWLAAGVAILGSIITKFFIPDLGG